MTPHPAKVKVRVDILMGANMFGFLVQHLHVASWLRIQRLTTIDVELRY